MVTKNQTKEMQRMTADLKKDIMATNVNQTDGMKEMIKDLKKDIMATRNRAREMQTITPHLKEDIMATKNQTERMTTRRAFKTKLWCSSLVKFRANTENHPPKTLPFPFKIETCLEEQFFLRCRF